MVGIKGQGDVYQIWEEQIPMVKVIDGAKFRLYATFMKRGEARSSATSLRDSTRSLTKSSKMHPWRVRVVPVRIKRSPGRYSGNFTCYCVYVERR